MPQADDRPALSGARREEDGPARHPARLTARSRAILTLLALGALGLAALRVPAPAAAPAGTASHGDVAAFQAIVAKLRGGASYYPTVGFELRARGYPTRDAFNWRTPVLLTALAATPELVGRAALFALLALLCVATLATVRHPLTAAWTATGLQVGVLAIAAAPAVVVVSEVWAGVLVGISVCAFARRRFWLAVGLGLAALFVRELAAPYCIVCTLLAAGDHRWREVAAWIGGACAYAAYYGWHVTQVWAHRLPTDLAHSSPWLEFGGLPFLLSTIQWLGWLLVLPAPLAALALVLVAAGIANARAPVHVRAASAAYVAFFLVAGQPFNNYWGLIAGPAWALACGYGVETVGQAMKAALAPRGTLE